MSATAAFTLAGALPAAALAGAIAWSIAWPAHRVWPPPKGRRDWRTPLVWTLTLVPFATAIPVGLLDAGTLHAVTPLRVGTGTAALAAGGALLLWGLRTLTLERSMGRADALVTAGPYAFTRNPQYVGDLLLVAGFVLATGSAQLAWIAAPLALALVLFPYAEEPWLRAWFGTAYEDYRTRVPRFLGRARAPEH